MLWRIFSDFSFASILPAIATICTSGATSALPPLRPWRRAGGFACFAFALGFAGLALGLAGLAAILLFATFVGFAFPNSPTTLGLLVGWEG